MRISDWSSDVCSSDLQPEAVLQATAAEGDALSRWVAGALLEDGSRDLPALLATAMQRRYSANPNERFFTGGGVHRFVNFDNADNGRVMSVAEALRHSVNLDRKSTTSELQSLMRISYDVFCLKKKQ